MLNSNEIIAFCIKELMKIYSSSIEKAVSLELPPQVLTPILKTYSLVYGIKSEELPKPISEFSNFKEFFTRPLKKGCRLIDQRPETIVSPADGFVLQSGPTDYPAPETIRVKGSYYTLYDILGKMSYWGLPENERKGAYILVYLSPGSCHRIYSPVNGNITARGFIPGTIYPVNKIGRNLVPHIYSKNSRVTLKIADREEKFIIFLVLIGALAVGDINLTYDGEKKFKPFQKRETLELFTSPVSINKGQEIGVFNLGSSIIIICYAHKNYSVRILKQEGKIRIGEPIMKIEEDMGREI